MCYSGINFEIGSRSFFFFVNVIIKIKLIEKNKSNKFKKIQKKNKIIIN